MNAPPFALSVIETGVIHIVCQQGTQEWLDARCGAVTASRFAEACERVGGLDDRQQAYIGQLKAGTSAKLAAELAGYASKPTGAWIDKAMAGEKMERLSDAAMSYAWLIAMERIAKRPLDETFMTWQMRRGQDEEPNARLAYEIRQARSMVEAGIAFTPDKRFGYSTDGYIDDDPEGPGLGEIKVPSSPTQIAKAWTAPDAVVRDYIHQINGGLWITGRLWCDLIIYTPWLASIGKKLWVKRIYRDEDAIDKLATDLIEFEGQVQKCENRLRAARDPSEPGDEAPVSQTLDTSTLGSTVTKLATSLVKSQPLTGLVPDLPY